MRVKYLCSHECQRRGWKAGPREESLELRLKPGNDFLSLCAGTKSTVMNLSHEQSVAVTTDMSRGPSALDMDVEGSIFGCVTDKNVYLTGDP
jgi:hypothetical protein